MKRQVRWFLARLNGLVYRQARERNLEAELQFHLDEETDERTGAGLTARQAAREARRSLGNLALVREDARKAWVWPSIESASQDVRYGLRGLRRSPGFAIAAILTFALGIGSATAMFSVVDAVLLEPLPFRDSDQLVRLTTTISATAAGGPSSTITGAISVAELLELRARSRALSGAGVYVTDFRTLTGAASTARLEGWRVEPVLFEMLGASTVLGRVFRPGESGVVLLSQGTWRDQFGAARDVIGRSILLDGSAYTVVGIMPASFEFPFELSNRQYWVPLTLSTETPDDLRIRLPMVARLRNGVSLVAAAAEVNGMLDDATTPENSYTVVPLQDEMVAPVKRALLVLMLGASGVLLIAGVNVTNLLLSRGTVREREIAVRLALGASRTRVVRQLVTEGVMLAILGALAGVALAAAALELAYPLATTLTRMDVGRLASFPRLNEVAIDTSVVMIALAAAVAMGVVLGLVPAIRAIGLPMLPALRAGASTAGPRRDGGRRGALRPVLVIAEIALATVLLISSGLLLRSFVMLATVPLGYEPEHVLTFQVATPEDRYEGARIQAFAEDLVSRLDALPEVDSAAYAPLLPMVTLLQSTARFRRTPQPLDSPKLPVEDFRGVSPAYFQTMGIRVVAGRGFNEDDGIGRPKVVVINRALALRDFGDDSPVGQNVYLLKQTEPWRVVGVIEDVRQKSRDQDPAPQVFISLRQSPMDLGMRFLQYYAVRTPGNPLAVVPRVRDVLRAMDSDAALYNVAPMASLVANSVSRPRLYAVLAAAGSAIALALASIGIYGVISSLVAARTREFGIRIALGASPVDVCRMVVGRGLILTGVGLTLGLAGAAAAVRSLEGLLFGLTPLDPATFLTSALLFSLVATAACAIPALRATRIDPAVALRSE
jgi:predicted permease